MVRVKGSPFWWSLDGKVEEIGGFYTTRFVMSDSRDAAIAQAVEIVMRDLLPTARNPPDSPVRIEIDECAKLDGVVTRQGAGLSFWLEKEDSREALKHHRH